MKSCLNEYWTHFEEEYPPNGNWGNSELKRISFLIAMELRRLGYSEVDAQYEFRQWLEERCIVRISPQEADRHVFGAVRWVYNKPYRELGCSKEGLLVQGGDCFKDVRPCEYDRKNNQNKIISKRLKYPSAFNDFGWPEYLKNTYGIYRLILDVYTQIRIAYFDSPFKAVCISMKDISLLILASTKEYKKLYGPQISRAIHVLENEGLIIIAEKGCAGKKRRRANCYIVVDPPPPCPKQIKTRRRKNKKIK